MRSLRLALALTALALSVAPGASLAQSVGVTAAVNQSARGTQPNAGVRTIAIGDNVIYNERIETDTVGLVQILLADGTTFTVGPNSALVIDSFVYDPGAGTAQVAATMTRGVLRFIGGATSKTPDGVAINTPVGTVGIRGAVTDIHLNPPPGTPPHIDLIFGSEVTLRQGGGGPAGRLYQAGYSLVFGGGGNVEVRKTPPGWTGEVQAALSGRPGTNGGAPVAPTNQRVAQSGVPGTNSERPVGDNAPTPPVPQLSPQEVEDLLVAAAVYEQFRPGIVNNPPPPPGGDPEPEPEPEPFLLTRFGAGAGIVDYTIDGSPATHPSVTTTFALNSASLAAISYDTEGNLVGGVIDVTSVDCSGCRVTYNSLAGTLTAKDVFASGDSYTVAATGSVVDHTAVTLPAGVAYCECDFLDWGFWSASASVTNGVSTATFDVQNGTWAVADITGNPALEGLGVAEDVSTYATYSGHAIGTATDGVNSYTAAGGLDMEWSFANRAGYMWINDFDGRDFQGSLFGDPSTPYFGGSLSDSYVGGGSVRGGFANDGTTPAAGVLGDFHLFDNTWEATGVFVGERGPDGFYSED